MAKNKAKSKPVKNSATNAKAGKILREKIDAKTNEVKAKQYDQLRDAYQGLAAEFEQYKLDNSERKSYSAEEKAAKRRETAKVVGRENAEVTAGRLDSYAKIAFTILVGKLEGGPISQETANAIVESSMLLGETASHAMNDKFHELVKIETDNAMRQVDVIEAEEAEKDRAGQAMSDAVKADRDADDMADEVAETQQAEKTGTEDDTE